MSGDFSSIYSPVIMSANDSAFLPEADMQNWLDGAIATTAPLVGSTTGTNRKPRRSNRGGRPPGDWTKFDREMIRIIALDAGYLTSTELRKRMKDWAPGHMAKPPADRTIDRHITNLVADGVLAG